MANCTYEFEGLVFKSEQALDQYLLANIHKYKIPGNLLVTRSAVIDPQYEQYKKLSRLKRDNNTDANKGKYVFDEYGERQYIADTSNRINASSITDTLPKVVFTTDPTSLEVVATIDPSGSTLTTKFNAKDEQTTLQMNDEDYAALTADRGRIVDYGNAIHAVADKMKSTIDKATGRHIIPGVDTIAAHLRHALLDKNVPENQIQTLAKGLHDTFKHISNDGKNQILTEVTLLTKITPGESRAESMVNRPILGRLDIVSINPEGDLSVYELKVSGTPVGNPETWGENDNDKLREAGLQSSAKKLKTEYQLGTIRALLKRNGFNNKNITLNVIPIHLQLKPIENISEGESEIVVNGINFEEIVHENKMSHLGKDGVVTRQLNFYIPTNERIPDDITIDIEAGLKGWREMFGDVEVRAFHVSEIERQRKFIKQYGKVADKEGVYRVIDPVTRKYFQITESNLNDDDYLGKYIEKLNKANSSHVEGIAKALDDYLNGGETSLEQIVGNSARGSAILQSHLGMYAVGEWRVVKNKQFLELGLIALENQHGEIDIISITAHDVMREVALTHGTDIYNKWLKRDQIGGDSLDATYGNLMSFMALNIFNANDKVFQNKKLRNVKVINSSNGIGTSHNTTELVRHFGRLASLSKVENKFDEGNVMDIFTAAQSVIRDLEQSVTYKYGLNKFLRENFLSIDGNVPKAELIKIVKSVIDTINKTNHDFRTQRNEEVLILSQQLHSLYNYLRGFKYFSERDAPEYIDLRKGVKEINAGINVLSPTYSQLKIIREMDRLMSTQLARLRKTWTDWSTKHKREVIAYGKAKGYNSAMGGAVDYYDKLFVKNNGKIDSNMILKNPWGPDPSLDESDKKYLKFFFQELDKVRYKGKTEEYIDTERAFNPKYWEVPLIRANAYSSLKYNGILGGAKESWKSFSQRIEGIFQGQAERIDEVVKQQVEMYSKFDYDREGLLSEYGEGAFEKNLEFVLNEFVFADKLKETHDDTITLLKGYKIGLLFDQEINNRDLDATLTFVDNYINTNIYKKSIMKQELYSLHQAMSIMKQFTSIATLGMNPRAFLRETLQGLFLNLSRTSIKYFGENQFGLKEYTWAMTKVMTEMPQSVNQIKIADLMNMTYGMANADQGRLVELAQVDRGLKGFNSNYLYATSWGPDYMNRLTILLAQMKKDGVYDAHSLVDDELVYDWTKDSRFKEYARGNKSSKGYAQERALYLKMLEDFNEAEFNNPDGSALKEGDKLPMAYTPRQQKAIKDYSDFTFGHFDQNTKMMMQNMFIGSITMQFMTFISAKIEQWFTKGDVYSLGREVPMLNEDGKQLYRIYNDQTGKHEVVDNVSYDDISSGKATLMLKWEGSFQEGIAWSVIKGTRAIWKPDQRDVWKNKYWQKNMKLFVSDFALFAVLGMLFRWVWIDWEELKEEDYVTKMATNAFVQSLEDFNIISQLGGISLDVKSFGFLGRIWNDIGASVIKGKDPREIITENLGLMK